MQEPLFPTPPFHEFFSSSRVAVRGIFYNQHGQILLVHHRDGFVLLPGGHVEISKDVELQHSDLNTALLAGLEREITEELNIPPESWQNMNPEKNFTPFTLINWGRGDEFCFDFVGSMEWDSEIIIAPGQEITRIEWIEPSSALTEYQREMPDNIKRAILAYNGYGE